MAAAVRLARPSSRRRQPVSDHRGSAREDEQEARVKGAAHRSFLNHLLSSTSISVQSVSNLFDNDMSNIVPNTVAFIQNELAQ